MTRTTSKILLNLPIKTFTVYKYLLVLILPVTSVLGQGSILDDSTQNVYNETTITFLYESQYLNNDTLAVNPDTLIDGFRFPDKVRETGWRYQDLGNNGTASKSYLPQLPNTIAVQNGFHSFHLYAPNAKDIKYYNTKSPYTNMFYEQNNRGLLKAGFTHSQNIKPNWNATFDVNRITSSKQFSASTSEDRLADHWNYTLGTNYTSTDKKYTLLASWIHFNHKQNEQGGMGTNDERFQVDEPTLDSDYNSFYEERLSNVFSRERWNDIHIYQQYNPSNGFQLYNILDYKRHSNFFSDRNYTSNYNAINYADTLALDSLKTTQRFQVVQNEFGLKGKYKGFNYIAGAMPRVYFNRFLNADERISNFEFIGKLNLKYQFNDSTTYANGKLELSNRGYLVDAVLSVKNAQIRFHQSDRPAEILFQTYRSDLLAWNNDFKNPKLTSLSFEYPLTIGKFFLKPFIQVQNYAQYLYFDNFQQPQQLDNAQMIQAEAIVGWRGKWLSFSQEARFNGSSNNTVFSIPRWTLHSNVEAKINYANVLDLFLGLDLHYKSSHFAMAYSPLLQSFYTQQTDQVWGLPVVDAYVKFKVKNVKVSLVFNYLNQGLQTQGYFTTPGYLGLRRAFWVKVNWPLFS